MSGGFETLGRKDEQRPSSIAKGRVMRTAIAPKTAVINEQTQTERMRQTMSDQIAIML